jgi:hypothetical protein
LGRLAAEEGQPEQAEKLYRQAMSTQQGMGAVVAASEWMFHLALLYEALPLLERAVEVAERAGHHKAGRRRAALERVRGRRN